MKRTFSPASAISISALLLLKAASSYACETGSVTITNLPAIPEVTYQVNGLNQAGKLTGFFEVFQVHLGHAFLYDAGTLTDFGTLGGSTSEGLAINTAGQIVGSADLPGGTQSHAFVTSSGALQDLGTLGGLSSSAAAISDSGVIVGGSDLANAYTNAFIYNNGAMTSLGTLGGNFSTAYAVNNSAVVVGESTIASTDLHAFVYSNGTLSDLGTLGGNYSSAFAINDAGVIAGESSVASSDIHAFVYSGGVMADLGTFGGTYSTAYLVNSNSQVIGYANVAGDQDARGFVYSNGTLTDLGTLGGTSSFADGINNLGQIVGDSLTATGDDHAFLWQNGTMTDLNTLLPANSGWELTAGLYINDAGRIVGTGSYQGSSTWFIMDVAGANNPPVAVAGPDQTVDCQAQVTLDGSGSTDPNNSTLTYEWSSGGAVLGTSQKLTVSLPLGTNVVTLKVADTCGESAQTNLTVIVTDTAPPTGSCPAAATASADSNCQAAVPNFVPQVMATDNCTPSQALVISQSPVAGTLVGLGPHTVTMTVTDASGNSSICTVLFTVVDTTPPTILSTPASFTLSAGQDCQAQVPNLLPNVSATDSCTPANQLVKAQNPAAGTLVGIGSHTVVVTVTDAAGNSSTANVSFTVSDTTAPTILGTPGLQTVSTDAHCQGVVPNVLTGVLATDNCTPANQLVMSQNPTAGTVLPAGQYTIVVTVSDAAGNSSTASVPLTIADTTVPKILNIPSPISVSTGANCQGVVPSVLGGVVATDNCTPAAQLVMNQNPVSGTLLPAGQYTILVTVSDAAGNSSTANVPLTVADTTPPRIVSTPGSVALSTDANCQAVVPNVLNGVVATDNCTSAAQLVMSQNPPAGTVLPAGQYTIVVTVADASGNASTANVGLTIADTTAPTILNTPGPITVATGVNGQGVIPNVLANVVATDNCTPANQLVLVQNPAAGTVVPAGQYTIVVTVTDASGNSANAKISLTVSNSTPPTIVALTASPNVLNPPNHQLVPVTVTALVTDSSDPAPVTKIVSITCSEPASPGDIQITGNLTATLAASKDSSGMTRTYTITVQATDVFGNSSTGVVTVTVPKNSSGNNITSGFGGVRIGSNPVHPDRDSDKDDDDGKRR
jgi:probable HAF family extracellular repeat protein